MQNGDGDPATDLLEEVFLNGELKTDYKYDEIRERAQVSVDEAKALDLDGLLNKLGLVEQ